MAGCPGTKLCLATKDTQIWAASEIGFTIDELMQYADYGSAIGFFEMESWQKSRTLVSDWLLKDLERTQLNREKSRRNQEKKGF